MSYEQFVKMSGRKRERLLEDAVTGDDNALKDLLQYSRELKREANKRLASLERAGLDYGKTYNNLMYYLQTELDSNRALSNKQLKYDIYAIFDQDIMLAKFLSNENSIPSVAIAREKFRISRLKEMGVIKEDFSYRKNKEFIRFLGNEEVSGAIEEYGSSDVIVDILNDVYENSGTNGLREVSIALTEFLSHRKTFDEAMEDVGVKIEDYIFKQRQS